MGVGGLEILPILFAEVAHVVKGHPVPTEIGHGLEVLMERWVSEFKWVRFTNASLAYKKKPSKHPASEGDITVESSLTLLGLTNFHWDVRKGNLNRPWPHGLLVVEIILVVIAPVHHVTVNAWVDVGVIRVDLTGADERVTVPGLTVASSRVPTSSSVRVSSRDGVLSLNTVWELVVDPESGLLGRGQTRWVDVLPDEVVCEIFSYGRFLRDLVPMYQ